MATVSEFVNNDIVDAGQRRADEVAIECDATFAAVAAPTPLHGPNGEVGCPRQFPRETFPDCLKAFVHLAFGVLAVPAGQEDADTLGRLLARDGYPEITGGQADSVFISILHLQPVLPTEIEVRLATDVSPLRSPRQELLEVTALS